MQRMAVLEHCHTLRLCWYTIMIAHLPFGKRSWQPWAIGSAAVVLGLVAALAVTSISSTPKLIVLVLGLAAAGATVLRVEWGLLALIFMGYTRFSDIMVRNGAPSTLQPFLGLLLLILLVRWFLYKEQPAGWAKPGVLVLIYGLTGMATLMWARDVGRAQTGVIEYFKDSIIVVIIIMLLREPPTLRRAIWVLLGAGIFMATLTTFQQVSGTLSNNYLGFAKAGIKQIVEGEADDYRIAGPYNDPNFYAQVLLILIPLAIDRMLNERKKILRLTAAWALVMCVLSVFFTFSRGAFLGLILIVLFMMVRRPPKIITLLIIIALTIPMIQFLPANYVARLETIPDAIPGLSNKDVREESSFRGRSSAQLSGLLMFLDHPLFGVGVLNFGVYYPEYSRGLGIDNKVWDQSPHNLYLEILTEKGLVGLSAFLLLISVFFRGLFSSRRQFLEIGNREYAQITEAYMIGLASFMFTSIFLHMSYPRFFWVVMGIGFAIPNIAQRLKTEHFEALHDK